MKHIFTLLIITMQALLVLSNTAYTQWSNIPICVASGNQSNQTIVSDGSGGAVITWADARTGTADIYAQRINSSGTVQWSVDGVVICTATGGQYTPKIVSDGSGGAIITWADNRSGTNDIYAQRINSSGAVQWAVDGVAICTATGVQFSQAIASDGSGGAIITWQDARTGSSNIYARKINSDGVVQWAVDGVAICTASSPQFNPTIVSDGSGGAIITWEDTRGFGSDIYAQRINSSGTVQWTANGVIVCGASGSQNNPMIVSDDVTGAIITWQDYRSTSNADIYAQRINLSGVVQWISNGEAICTTTVYDQIVPTITNDGASGAIITWSDHRTGTDAIYVQRINSSGAVQWTSEGVVISNFATVATNQQIVSDDAGGAIITWEDSRGDIYAQRINLSGVVQWTANGVGIGTGGSSPTIVSSGSGGAIIATSGTDIYASQLDGNGLLPVELTLVPDKFKLSQNYPNPFNPSTTIQFGLPNASYVKLKIFNILGQEVATLINENRDAGQHSVQWNAHGLASGVYFYRLSAHQMDAKQTTDFVQIKKLLLIK